MEKYYTITERLKEGSLISLNDKDYFIWKVENNEVYGTDLTKDAEPELLDITKGYSIKGIKII